LRNDIKQNLTSSVTPVFVVDRAYGGGGSMAQSFGPQPPLGQIAAESP
jgi:hypothetical protein